MTDYETIALEKVLRTFDRDFSRVIADALAQMPEALESEVLHCLGKRTDVNKAQYCTALPVMRANYGTEIKFEYESVPLIFDEPDEDEVCLAKLPEFLSL